MDLSELIIQEENQVSHKIIGAAIKIHKKLGPGLFEKVYEQALAYELKKLGFDVESQVAVPMVYEEIQFDIGFRLDILVNSMLIIEVKSIETITALHYKQLLTYLRFTEIRLGLLINFNSEYLTRSIKRVVNGF